MGIGETVRMVTRMGQALPRIAARRVNLDLLLDRHAATRPDATAIAFEDSVISYRELRDRSHQSARFFAEQGIEKGDRVVVLFDNRPDFLFVFHGLQRLGAIAALVNTSLTGTPLAHVVRIAEAKLLVLGSEHAHKLESLAKDIPELDVSREVFVHQETESDPIGHARSINAEVDRQSSDPMPRLPINGSDHCAYIYTSGTTGLPKAAVIAHYKLGMSGAMAGNVLHRISPGELIYVALPLYHSNALMLGWSAALSTGAGIALRRKFSAREFFPDLRRFGATNFIYIGELCRYLLNSPPQEGESEHSVRAIAGNGMRPDVWEAFQDRFKIPIVREIYGATEGTGMLINFSGRPGMVGKLVPGMTIIRCDQETGDIDRTANGFCEKVSAGDTGLLVSAINRVSTFEGYLDKKASEGKILTDVFKKGDTYFNTGDLLKLHEGKWVSFVDRVGDTFRWKGENVSTNEVAEVVNAGPGVVETNVYGVEITGCEGRAGMAAIQVVDDFDPDALARYVAAELPVFQRPLFLRIKTAEHEVTGTFKHQKVKSRNERFDPDQLSEPLYYLDGNRYLPVDAPAFRAIESGEIRPG